MRAYFDSSAVLAFLLQQKEGVEAAKIWMDHDARVSSILLKAECLINLRRNATGLPKTASKEWLQDRFAVLSNCLDEVNLKDLDDSILEVMNQEAGLVECRTLDAIHLATALYFREKGDEDLVLVSLDVRMRKTAVKLKIKILPTSI